MRTTLKDIAGRVGVTSQLVSFYLNHPDTQRVAKDTRKKIDAAVKELNYQPNGIARALVSGKTKTIGLIIGGFTQRKRGCFVHELMNAAKKRGYHLLVAITNYDQEEERNALEYMLAQQVDGILYHLYLDPESQVYARLKERRYPILMHVPQACDDFNTIGNDPSAIRSALVEFLNQGHKRICYVGGEKDYDFLYFDQYCKELGIIASFVLSEPFDQLCSEIEKTGSSAVIFNHGFSADKFYSLRPGSEIVSVVSYSLPFEYISDHRIIGAIYHDFNRRADREMEHMIEIVNKPDNPVSCELRPSSFLKREEWRKLYESQCSSSEYELFL